MLYLIEVVCLFDCIMFEVQVDCIVVVCEIVECYYCYVVLKGSGIVIVVVDGCWWINFIGNLGMVMVGMGDVLSGIIVVLFVQGWFVELVLFVVVYLYGVVVD